MNAPHLHADLEAMSRALAERLVGEVENAVAARGSAHIALAGGSTPRRLYQVLAEPGFRDRLDWSHLHLWFGDERCVPRDHPDSNYRMVREALLDHVPLPAGQVHPMPRELATLNRDAARYADALRACIPCDPPGLPRFDLVLLGLGDDGHTASLFPGTCILHERERLVAGVYVPRLRAWRVSLTYPVLRNARTLWLLASGPGKAAILGRIGRDPDAGLPIQGLADLARLEWHLDADAARELPA